MYVGRRITGGNIHVRTGPGAIEVHMYAFDLCDIILNQIFLTPNSKIFGMVSIGGLKI